MEGARHLVANNIIHDHPRGFGIQVYPANRDSVVVNNTVAYNAYSGIVVGGSGGVSNVRVINNVFAFNSQYGIAHDSTNPTSCQVDHNLLFGNGSGAIQPGFSGCDFSAGNLTSDPLFAGAATWDFHLLVNSPALNVADLRYAMEVDFDLEPRPQGAGPDLGADERP